MVIVGWAFCRVFPESLGAVGRSGRGLGAGIGAFGQGSGGWSGDAPVRGKGRFGGVLSSGELEMEGPGEGPGRRSGGGWTGLDGRG